MRIGIVETNEPRRRAFVEAIAALGAVAVRVEPAAVRRGADDPADFRVDALLVAGSALDAAGAGAVGGLPWCLADDGVAVPPTRLRRGFAGAIPAPPPGAPPEEFRAVAADALDLLGRRLDLEAARSLVASAGAAILHAGADRRVLRVNGAYARLFGGAPVDPQGRLLVELVRPVGDPASVDAFHRAVAAPGAWSGEVRLEGAPVTTAFAATVAPVTDGPLAARGVVATLHDLSSRCAVEDELRAAYRRLERRAWSDPLTGLANRAFFDDALDRELARARRTGAPIAVLLADVDDFKRVNDSYGHDAGDELLAAVSGSLRLALREGDVLARYGGDEFCVLLPGADAPTALGVAQRLREHAAALRHGPAGEIRVTTSVGLATSAELEPGAGARALVRLADRAMYAAKRAGGDRVAESATVAAPEPQ